MIELGFQVRKTDQLQKKVRVLRILVGSINFTAFCAMCWLSIQFMFVYHDFVKSCVTPTTCDQVIFRSFMRKLGWVSGSYYTLLTVSLICSQYRLAKALKEIIG